MIPPDHPRTRCEKKHPDTSGGYPDGRIAIISGPVSPVAKANYSPCANLQRLSIDFAKTKTKDNDTAAAPYFRDVWMRVGEGRKGGWGGVTEYTCNRQWVICKVWKVLCYLFVKCFRKCQLGKLVRSPYVFLSVFKLNYKFSFFSQLWSRRKTFFLSWIFHTIYRERMRKVNRHNKSMEV